MSHKQRKTKGRSRRGQGITEYAAVLAFVAVLVAMAFSVAQGTLFANISQSYSSVSNNLSNLNSYSSNGGN